jgi:hypothetical protein
MKNALRRQYKKDTLYVLDLYTLTYDSHETLDSLGEYVSNILNVPYIGSRYSALSSNYSESGRWTTSENPVILCYTPSSEPYIIYLKMAL